MYSFRCIVIAIYLFKIIFKIYFLVHKCFYLQTMQLTNLLNFASIRKLCIEGDSTAIFPTQHKHKYKYHRLSSNQIKFASWGTTVYFSADYIYIHNYSYICVRRYTKSQLRAPKSQMYTNSHLCFSQFFLRIMILWKNRKQRNCYEKVLIKWYLRGLLLSQWHFRTCERMSHLLSGEDATNETHSSNSGCHLFLWNL